MIFPPIPTYSIYSTFENEGEIFVVLLYNLCHKSTLKTLKIKINEKKPM